MLQCPELEELNRRLRTIETELREGDFRNNITKQTERLHTLEQKNARLQNSISVRDSEIEVLSRQLVDLTSASSQALNDVDDCKAMLLLMANNMEDCTSQTDRQAQKVRRMEGNLDKLSSAQETCNKETNTILEKILAMETRFMDLDTPNTTSKSDSTSSESRDEQLKSDLMKCMREEVWKACENLNESLREHMTTSEEHSYNMRKNFDLSLEGLRIMVTGEMKELAEERDQLRRSLEQMELKNVETEQRLKAVMKVMFKDSPDTKEMEENLAKETERIVTLEKSVENETNQKNKESRLSTWHQSGQDQRCITNGVDKGESDKTQTKTSAQLEKRTDEKRKTSSTMSEIKSPSSSWGKLTGDESSCGSDESCVSFGVVENVLHNIIESIGGDKDPADTDDISEVSFEGSPPPLEVVEPCSAASSIAKPSLVLTTRSNSVSSNSSPRPVTPAMPKTLPASSVTPAMALTQQLAYNQMIQTPFLPYQNRLAYPYPRVPYLGQMVYPVGGAMIQPQVVPGVQYIPAPQSAPTTAVVPRLPTGMIDPSSPQTTYLQSFGVSIPMYYKDPRDKLIPTNPKESFTGQNSQRLDINLSSLYSKTLKWNKARFSHICGFTFDAVENLGDNKVMTVILMGNVEQVKAGYLLLHSLVAEEFTNQCFSAKLV